MEEKERQKATHVAGMEAPEVYTNQVQFRIGLYDVSLDFGIQFGADPKDKKSVAVVRMSPHHALIMAKLFIKNMKEYENRVGKINIPREQYEKLGISEE